MSTISLFDARPFFEKALAYGVQHSIISHDSNTDPGFTLSRLAYFGAVPWVASNTAWPVI